MGYTLNSEAYILFAQIEVGIREFLIQLINKMGVREWTVSFLGRTHLESVKEIGKRIHEARERNLSPEIEDLYVATLKKEFKTRQDGFQDSSLLHPFYYLSWADLTGLINKNVVIIENSIGKLNRQLIFNNLIALNFLRNDIAHSRFISNNDYLFIKSAFDQISVAIPDFNRIYEVQDSEETVEFVLNNLRVSVEKIKLNGILQVDEIDTVQFSINLFLKSFWINTIFIDLIPQIKEFEQQVIQYKKIRHSPGGLLKIIKWKEENMERMSHIKKIIDERKFLINPFDRHALSDFRQLAGRGDEFRQIRFRLRNAALNKSWIKSILIIGERGVGKTSFLNLIEAECDINNLIPVRVDLTESNSSNSFDFFWHLFRQAINKLFSLNIFGGKGGDIDGMIQAILNGDGIDDQANWVFNSPILRKNYLNNKSTNFEFHLFVEDLRVMLKELSELKDSKFNEKTKILFLVDESQHIYSDKKIIEELRFVMQSYDLGVGFVFAGDSTFKTSLWEKVFGGSYRDFEIINLKYFDDVESVIDFFKKSLSTINWTDNEIEETLFYKFKIACRQIFNLTSGKPAWINTIASKMFERCMSEEVRQMRFDKQAQNNVKQLLEDSGELDKSKLEYIENLSPKYEKWLAEIFACEVNTFNQVYFLLSLF